MLGSLSRSVLSNVSKLPKLQCLGSNVYNNLMPVKRCYNEHKIPTPGKEASAKTKRRQTLDGVPLNYAVIYNSHEYHTITQHACTALVGSFCIGGAVHMLRNFEELFPDIWSTAMNLWLASIYLFANVGTSFIAYRSPVRIYFDKETGNYKAIFNDWIPTKIRTLDFRKGDVEHLPPGDELSLFRHDRYKIKDQKLYMLIIFFRYPADLYNMFEEMQHRDEPEESTS